MGWKPTIIPIVCSYFKENLKDYDRVKEGDFISRDQIITAVTDPIKEKTCGIRTYVHQCEVDALKSLDRFRQFYVEKAVHNCWKSEIIPHVIDYIFNSAVSDFKKKHLFRTSEQIIASSDEKYDKYHIVGSSALRDVKKQNLAAYIAKVIGRSESEASKIIESKMAIL